MFEDEPTRPRLDSHLMAQTESAMDRILRALSGVVLTVETEREIRAALDTLARRSRRQSQTAVKVASEAETEAHNERVRREVLQRRVEDLELELAAAGIRERAMAAELSEYLRKG